MVGGVPGRGRGARRAGGKERERGRAALKLGLADGYLRNLTDSRHPRISLVDRYNCPKIQSRDKLCVTLFEIKKFPPPKNAKNCLSSTMQGINLYAMFLSAKVIYTVYVGLIHAYTLKM